VPISGDVCAYFDRAGRKTGGASISIISLHQDARIIRAPPNLQTVVPKAGGWSCSSVTSRTGAKTS